MELKDLGSHLRCREIFSYAENSAWGGCSGWSSWCWDWSPLAGPPSWHTCGRWRAHQDSVVLGSFCSETPTPYCPNSCSRPPTPCPSLPFIQKHGLSVSSSLKSQLDVLNLHCNDENHVSAALLYLNNILKDTLWEPFFAPKDPLLCINMNSPSSAVICFNIKVQF